MTILIFGGTGMLGHMLVRLLSEQFDVWTTIRGEFSSVQHYGIFERQMTVPNVDADDLETVKRAIETAKPAIVINAIGSIKQKLESLDAQIAKRINAVFPHRLHRFSHKYGFRLITMSSDCVFDGLKGNYSEESIPNAQDIYGMSKSLGEVNDENALTIRTSVIGRELVGSHSLVEWFLSHRGGTVDGFRNAIYTGFPSIVLARIISFLIEEHPSLSGVWHVSSDPISKYDLLMLVNEYYNAGIEIVPNFDLVLDRSLDSTRFRRVTGFQPVAWREMIEDMARDPFPYDHIRTRAAA